MRRSAKTPPALTDTAGLTVPGGDAVFVTPAVASFAFVAH